MKKFILILLAITFVLVASAQITADFEWTDSLCSEGSVTFIDASTGDAVLGWSWKVDGSELGNSSTFTHIFPQVTIPTDFDISLYVTATTGYDDNVAYTVTIHPNPTATIDVVDPTICEGANIALTENAGDAISWEWSSGETSADINPTVITSTAYAVTVTDANGCTNTASSIVYIHPQTVVTITPADTTICEGDGITLEADGAETYDWSTTETTAIINHVVDVQTIFTVTGTDLNGCTSTVSSTVDVYTLPVVTITPADITICEGDGITLEADGAETYDWSTTETTAIINHVVDVQTIFTVTGTDLNGCVNSAIATIDIYNIDTTVVEGSYCTGSMYDFYGIDLSIPGTYYHTLVSILTGCDSIIQLNLVELIPFDSLIVVSICDGDSLEWRNSWYNATGVYAEPYISIITGCDSIYTLDLTVDPLPILVTVLSDPSDGILTGTDGEISLSTSYVGTNYWTTKGAVMFSGNIAGTGSGLSLGTNYNSGTYDVWSETAAGCSIKQSSVIFIVEDGTVDIIATPTFGTGFSPLVDAAVEMTLYFSTVDIYDNPIILIEDGPTATSSGNVEFDDLDDGNYYVRSQVVDMESYPLVVPIYFYDGPTVDSANVITLDGVTLTVNVNHPEYPDTTGSNTAGGSVDTLGGAKSIMSTGLSDQIVILRNETTGEVLSAVITDSNGEYFIDNVPDNENLELYVTSFQYQNWTPAGFNSTTSTHYEKNFIAAGDSVYPATGSSGVLQLEKKIAFSIYPNPSSDYIYFDNIPDNAKLEIFSITGQKVLVDVRSNKSNLDISSLPVGVYSVVITTEDNTHMGAQKFIKK